MALSKINPTQLKTWSKLKDHFDSIKDQHMNDWFEHDPDRAQAFQINWNDFLVDYSKNRITSKTKTLLLQLAEEANLKEAIEQQFTGKNINETEDRAVLHTALRQKNKSKEVKEALNKMKSFSEAIIQGDWKGHTGKAITDVVNIGIGGSDLGPRMVTEALRYYGNHLNVHFVSNVDGDQSAEVMKKIKPETTLFIVVSKSFTTIETLTNARLFRNWFLRNLPKKGVNRHFVAVSSNIEEANKFGIAKKNIFPMWDSIGGRFSLWSAVGLSICCAIGFKNFQKLLDGAEQMDTHFRGTEFSENIPVLLGLISVWYNNFFKAESEAIIPYSQYLENFVPYLQQAFMESNGKSCSRAGKQVDYQTGSIVWGATGTNAQHAFFQLIHQGTKLIPSEFIGFKKSLHGNKKSHDKLMANFFAQTEALLKGKSKEQVNEELKQHSTEERNKLLPFKLFEGNKPTTTILIDQLTPERLGSLIALYEHKIFVQGVIWNIFSYDQWGVELGKQLANVILEQFNADGKEGNFDSSTASLLKNYTS